MASYYDDVIKNDRLSDDVVTHDVISSLPPKLTWLFHGCVVHSTDDQEMCIMEDMLVGVKDGKILFVEPAVDMDRVMKQFGMADDNIIKMTNSQFLMPGLIDCHAHASQYSFMGTGTDKQLLDWLDTYTFPAESRLMQDQDYGLAVYTKCVDRTLSYGTTTISYYATIHNESTMALVKALEVKGQRAFVGKVNMDMNSPANYVETRPESVERTERFVSEMLHRKNSLVTPCITPRFAVTCTMGLMKDLARIARTHDLAIQTHVSENIHEVRSVLDLFPPCPSYCDVYDQAGLLGPKTMLAHAIHLTDEELTLVKERGCGICHCPNSNFSLSSGVIDLRPLLEMNVKVGLGTDFSGGYSPSMLDAMRRGLDTAKLYDHIRVVNNSSNNNNNNSSNIYDSITTNGRKTSSFLCSKCNGNNNNNSSKGTTDNSKGTTDNSKGTTDNSKGTTDNSKGTTDNSKGTTDNSKGTTDNIGVNNDNQTSHSNIDRSNDDNKDNNTIDIDNMEHSRNPSDGNGDNGSRNDRIRNNISGGITYKHMFKLATLGSAQVMGLDDIIGNFLPGKEFDAILVDVSSHGSPIDLFDVDSRADLVQKFVFLGDDRNIVRVFVQGRQLKGPVTH